jgi:FkbM family methyltransferase
LIDSLRNVVNAALTHAKDIVYGGRGEPIRYGGHVLRYVPGTRPPRMKYRETGDFTTRNELRQIEFLLNNVQQGDLAFDVGAHAGQYAVLLGELVGPQGHVISFEPDAIARTILDRNISLNNFVERVTVETVALSDQNGTHTFFSLGGNSMSSLARTGLGTAAASAAVSESTVETVRLDDFVKTRNLSVPQWIKIDTEGAEISILKGAPQTLRSVRGILCELHPYTWEEFGSTFEELLALVAAAGRTIRYLDPDVKVSGGPVYGTVVIA